MSSIGFSLPLNAKCGLSGITVEQLINEQQKRNLPTFITLIKRVDSDEWVFLHPTNLIEFYFKNSGDKKFKTDPLDSSKSVEKIVGLWDKSLGESIQSKKWEAVFQSDTTRTKQENSDSLSIASYYDSACYERENIFLQIQAQATIACLNLTKDRIDSVEIWVNTLVSCIKTHFPMKKNLSETHTELLKSIKETEKPLAQLFVRLSTCNLTSNDIQNKVQYCLSELEKNLIFLKKSSLNEIDFHNIIKINKELLENKYSIDFFANAIRDNQLPEKFVKYECFGDSYRYTNKTGRNYWEDFGDDVEDSELFWNPIINDKHASYRIHEWLQKFENIVCSNKFLSEKEDFNTFFYALMHIVEKYDIPQSWGCFLKCFSYLSRESQKGTLLYDCIYQKAYQLYQYGQTHNKISCDGEFERKKSYAPIQDRSKEFQNTLKLSGSEQK